MNDPRTVRIGADGPGGLSVVNYRSADTLGVPPTITLNASIPTQGTVERSRVRLTAVVADDVQLRNVENAGTIRAEAPGSVTTVRSANFINNGSVEEINGGQVLSNP